MGNYFVCWDQKAKKLQLCINKPNFSKFLCSEVWKEERVLLLMLHGEHTEDHWLPTRKVSASLCRAGRMPLLGPTLWHSYTDDFICSQWCYSPYMVPHTKWGWPCHHLFPVEPLCHLPSPARCQHHATACTNSGVSCFSTRAPAAPGRPGLAAVSGHAMCLPRYRACFPASSLLSFFQFPFRWAPEDWQAHCATPHGLPLPTAGAVLVAWVCSSCRPHTATGLGKGFGVTHLRPEIYFGSLPRRPLVAAGQAPGVAVCPMACRDPGSHWGVSRSFLYYPIKFRQAAKANQGSQSNLPHGTFRA